MAITKQLALNTVPQNIVVQSVCSNLTIKEDESIVAASGGTPFIIKKPSTGDANYIQAGKQYSFPAPAGMSWTPGRILGTIALPSGSTTGLQDEQ